MNYDFWYQPAQRTSLASSEFGAPNAYEKGFDLDDVGRGAHGQRMTSGTSRSGTLEQTIDLGEQGLVPLDIRWLHDPGGRGGLHRRRALELDVALPPLERLPGRPSP